MAKGIDILGTLRGKRGGVVYYRRSGEQVSRPKVTPKNPRSAKQAVQRMVLATAAKMASAYEPIVNHSFEGVTEGAKSVQKFRRYAMNALRSAAAAYLNDPSAVSRAANFAIKGAPVVGAMDGLQLSLGRLGMNGFSLADNSIHIVMRDAFSSTNITTQAAYEAELAKLGIEPGDQLTFVTQLVNETIVASATIEGGSEVSNFGQLVRFARVTFKSELPAEFSGTILSGTEINPALIEEQYGILPAFAEGTTSGGGKYLGCSFANVLPADNNVQTAGVIRSKLNEGKYYYSSCFMQADATYLDANDADPVYYTYMDGVATIDVGSTLYLQHAVAAPFVAGE